MKYEEYIKKIEESDNLAELSYLADEIRFDPDLTEKEKNTLLSIYLGRKRLQLADKLDIYYSEVESRLETLNIDETLYDALLSYLNDVAPERYTSVNTLRKNVLPYITEFIDYVSKRKRRTLTLEDLDVSRLKGAVIQSFLSRKTKSKYTQRMIYSVISVFGKWLENEYPEYIQRFPRIKIVIPKAPPEVRAERKIGKPRRLKELDEIFRVVSMPTPRVARERLPIYRYFYKFLLATGLRPAHALLFKVGDFSDDEVEWVEDVWGRDFVKLASYKVVEREKRERGEIITKKVPAPYVFISEDLYNEIYSYCVDEMGFSDDDYICPIPLRTLQRRAETVSEMTGIRDFSMYDFRDTWASVIYNCSGHDVSLVVEMGGWSSASIPVDIYARTMKPSEAIEIAKKYEIYLPPTIREKVVDIERGMKPIVTPEDIKRQNEYIQMLVNEIERLKEEIERLKRG